MRIAIKPDAPSPREGFENMLRAWFGRADEQESAEENSHDGNFPLDAHPAIGKEKAVDPLRINGLSGGP